MRFPAAPLAAEVYIRVAPALCGRILLITRPVALERRPRLEQRAVHREVVRGEQPALLRLRHHRCEEGVRDLMRE